jgi:hypothetical protein
MDPNEALARIRAELANGHTDPDRLVESVAALDGWLSKGGFPPSAWQPGMPALTGNDHIVTNARHPLESVHLGWSINISVHIHPDTPVVARLHNHEHRAVVTIGKPGDEAVLFVDAAQIERLANLFAVIRTRLRH